MPRASKDYNLRTENPELAKEWHPSRNGDLTPEDVTPGSGKKVWWVCKQKHEWKAVINSRNRGRGCPECSGQRVGKNNNLAVLHPELANEWHPIKNGTLSPEDVMPGSTKSVWWRCNLRKHNWQARIDSRVSGNDCPECSGKKVGKDNNLSVLYPEIAKEWHPTKNGNLTPRDITAGSKKKVWWRCLKWRCLKKGHEWNASVDERTGKRKRGCPECSGKKSRER